MLGEGMGVELNVRALGLEDEEGAGGPMDPRRNPEVTEGMIPRVIADIFQRIDDAPDSVEYVLRCSFVEIYLERICDLLQPWREDVWIGNDENGEACVAGAAEICCLDASDVYALLARGHAYRRKSNSDQSMDSNRSHVAFTLRLERKDRDDGKQISSRLIMVDLAGSELGKNKAAQSKDAASEVEGRMVNASLASLGNVIRGTLSRQGVEKAPYNQRAFTNPAKIAQLLKPCFGGSWFTTVICTGSPSSHNIHETINTIKFGQQARKLCNKPSPRISATAGVYKAQLIESEQRHHNLTSLVKMLAHECKHVRGRTKGKDSGNVPLWEVIEKITSSTKPDDETPLAVSIGEAAATNGKESSLQQRIKELESQVEEHRRARDKAESSFRDLKSDITALRRQKESIANEKLRTSRELHESKEQIKFLTQRNVELENYLQTSQFREKEAILFLRQFRTFYFRLLKSKAAHGSGTTKDITAEVSLKLSGVSDLADLLDVDHLMLESGLIEKAELGSDTSTVDYAPSKEAWAKSQRQAEKTQQREMHLIDDMYTADLVAQGIEPPPPSPNGGARELSFGQIASYRQKLLQTPAGQLAIKKELELENDLVEMGKKIVGLQNSLVAERAMVEALSARQGAMGKMKAAQELNTIKQELERKTNDLHAIVWKMNELHLVNKTMDTKVESREQHVNYLEEHLMELQNRNRRLVLERQEMEQQFREENTILEDQVAGMATQIWQLGDAEAMPLWRLLVPYTGEQLDLTTAGEEEHPRRLSLGNLQDEDVEGLIRVSEKNSK